MQENVSSRKGFFGVEEGDSDKAGQSEIRSGMVYSLADPRPLGIHHQSLIMCPLSLELCGAMAGLNTGIRSPSRILTRLA